MTFHAFGVNHLRAPVEVREALALQEDGMRELYRSLHLGPTSELILLSTCNRTEAYLYGTAADVDQIKAALAHNAGRTWPDDLDFIARDEGAIRHILEVASGLKSLVLGDAQIFSQLKEAYRVSAEEQRVGTTMHRLMHTAFRTAKRVINETDLSTGAASIPYQAVEVAKAHFESRAGKPLAELSALVIGSGSMGRLAGEALKAAGVKDLAFANRSEERGREVAAKYHASFIMWDARHAAASQRDLVIVATSAEQPVIHAEDLEQASAAETLFIDVSIPRNVEARVREMAGVSVVDLDEINHFLQETEDLRKTAVPDARHIVEEMLAEFVAWVFHHQALQPAIQAIAETFESIRDQEVSKHHGRFEDVDREELDRLTRSIIQKILAVPIVRLKSVDPESIDFVHGVQLLHALFRRDDCEDASDTHSSAAATRPVDEKSPPRESCPIEPELSAGKLLEGVSEEDLREVLRRFTREEPTELQ